MKTTCEGNAFKSNTCKNDEAGKGIENIFEPFHTLQAASALMRPTGARSSTWASSSCPESTDRRRRCGACTSPPQT
eukprot:5756374-Pleurochrysis_carterae.AAC.1